MALPVMEFQDRDIKLEIFLCSKINIPKGNY